jgi:hypothetical protein
VPAFLEQKLKAEYGANSSAPYAIMNKLGYMKGSRETPKGRAAARKHDRDAAPGRTGKLAALRGRMR